MKKKHPFISLALLCLLLATQVSFGQKREIIPLNQHFFPVTEKSKETQVYNMVSVKRSETESDHKIYTLSNRLVKQIEDSYNEEIGFDQRMIYRYDSLGALKSFSLVNLTENLHLSRYFEGDSALAEVVKKELNLFEVKLADGNAFESEFDPFKSGPADMFEFNKYLMAALSYPVQARRSGEFGIAVIALEVSAEGELIQSMVANPSEIYHLLAREAHQVVKRYPGGWRAALDLDGNFISSWGYVQVRFKLEGTPFPKIGNPDFFQ